jgi:outer membrane receptor protein involved in Fe transport
MNIRGAWSKTVARPSFREMGYYVSIDPTTDDLVVGNPLLDTSDVQSFDARVEYTWGDMGDLFALSGFYKEIENPIESIVLRNPLNFDSVDSALFRTFFNNPNDAELWGIEVEARKHLDFLGVEALRYLSVGGNYTYIDAEVDRTEAELIRSEAFFGMTNEDILANGGTPYTELKKSRRLFGQPEWIANADITFDHPDWGTRLTLAFFAISDVLDAAGSANINPDGRVSSFTLDRYVDSFHQLDLIMSQTIHFDLLPGDWALPSALRFKASIKNLTDSRRKIVYDPSQVKGSITERSVKIGRDFSFSTTYTVEF